jgi:hypothetical protein
MQEGFAAMVVIGILFMKFSLHQTQKAFKCKIFDQRSIKIIHYGLASCG